MPDILPAKCETVTWGKLERHCIAFDCIVMAVAYFERKGDVSRPHSVGLGLEIFTGQNNFIFLSSRFALFLFYSSKGDTRLPQYHNVRHQPDHSNTIYLIRYIYLWLCETVVVLVRNDRQARQQRGTMEKLIEAESAAPYLYHTDDVIRETQSTPALLVLQSGEQLDESHSLGLKSGYPLSVKTMFSTSHLKLGFSSFFKVAPLLFMSILMEKPLQYNLYRFYKE